MNIEELRDYCLAKPGVEEAFPFDQSVLVFKVKGKLFVLTNVDHYGTFNAKCDPEWAVQLREEYTGITPGYHMNKQQWNTVDTTGSVPIPLLRKLIDHSYDLVVAKLPKKDREGLKNSTE